MNRSLQFLWSRWHYRIHLRMVPPGKLHLSLFRRFLWLLPFPHVKSQIKRHRQILNEEVNSKSIINGPFKFDLNSYKFYKNEIELKLSSKETKLIKFFMEHPNKVFTKVELYQNVWHDNTPDDNSIMVYVKYLRNKIEDDPAKPEYIKTVWGIGYEFSVLKSAIN